MRKFTKGANASYSQMRVKRIYVFYIFPILCYARQSGADCRVVALFTTMRTILILLRIPAPECSRCPALPLPRSKASTSTITTG
ncbi:Secreted protein [Pseudomonas donghuensis]